METCFMLMLEKMRGMEMTLTIKTLIYFLVIVDHNKRSAQYTV
jgi:hypothetical protein